MTHQTLHATPIRRDLHFDLDRVDLRNWHGRGPIASHYMNALSLFFPEGERFFIHSVRNYRDRITEPGLKAAVTGFIGQEAMHGREHEDYNRKLGELGLPVRRLERETTFIIERLFKRTSKPTQLAITIALEHFTAIYADLVLKEPRILEGSDPALATMWRWHALEETEHKAVAFDVYLAVMGRGLRSYLLRTSVLAVITTTFLIAILGFHLRLLMSDKALKIRARDLARFTWYMFGPVGGLRRLVLPWLDYFKPGFHPWDHANQHFLAGIDDIVADVAKPPERRPVVVAPELAAA